MAAYYIIEKPGYGEIIEKKSHFIGAAYPIGTPDDAMRILERVRKQYWDARHNCHAYVCGEGDAFQKSSDDGEPSGTAGKPILETIHSRFVHDCIIVVTRYFGGTLLGTGGLVRAYSQAAAAALDAAVVRQRIEGKRIGLTVQYAEYEQVRHIASQLGTEPFDVEFTDRVSLKLSLDNTAFNEFDARLTATFGGRIELDVSDAFILK